MDYKTIHGAQIPALGFGTFLLNKPDARRMVEVALGIGYRHIDTASIYHNETEVGQAIKASSVVRDALFLTTKTWIDSFHEGALEAAAEASLRRLGTDYVDLLLLHWPHREVPMEETLGALQRVQRAGKARHIGISNHTADQMQRAHDIVSPGTLVTNQVEYHPFLAQRSVLTRARDLGMLVTAYCPLAQGKVLGEPVLQDIGSRYEKNAAQVALRWLIQQDAVLAIPRTRTPAHARANFEITDFALTDADMASIDRLQGNGRIISPSDLAPEWDAA